MDLRAVLERVLPAVRAPRARGWQGEGEGRAHQLLRARHGGNPVPVLRRRTRCRAGASSISPRFRGRTRGEPFGEGDHAVSRPNSRSRARRRALRVADGRGVFSHRRPKHAVRSFSVFRKCFLVGVSCRASDEKGLCVRAPVSTQCGALESPGGAPARRGVAGHTPAPACASARGPRSRMRRTRGSTDRTHSAFALAITATRSRPRERVLVFPRFDERLAQNAKRKDFSLSFVCFRCFRGRRAARNGSSRGSDAFLLTPIRLSL